MDPTNIIQMTLYSSIYTKILKEAEKYNMFENNTIILAIGFIYFYNYIPFHWIYYLYNNYCSDYCEVQLPYHTRTFTNFSKTVVKMIYSERFCAISYFILHNNIKDISSICEITNVDIDQYGGEKKEYILLPMSHNKIKISDNPIIYFENIVEYDDPNDSSSGSHNKNTGIKEQSKKYIYRLSMPGKKNIHILKKFLEDCEKVYKTSTEKKEQMIFEYVTMETDENNRQTMNFVETRFFSNKRLSDNVFFEGRKEFIEEIQKFPYRKLDENSCKTELELEYAKLGKTFKKAILLHGPPGGGKTSIIKGILNETKRHAVKIQWSRIKTCAQFSSLFNNLRIHGNKYNLGELCYIFEDFDANKMELLKKRKDISLNNTTKLDKIISSDTKLFSKTEDKEKIISIMNVIDDELTLDYVLNVFDGVAELHDALLIFTTNAELECFDPALIRPGRIDLIMKLGECSQNTICEMLSLHYGLSIHDVSTLLENKMKTNDKKSKKKDKSKKNIQPKCILPSYLESIVSKHKDINKVINELLE